MSSKRNSGDWTVVSTMTTPAASRRPASVREKLSGFVRRGRGLAKKTTMSVLGESRHERPSLDESLHPKVLPRVQVQDFGTSSLDIDLLSLEAFRDVQQPEEKRKKEAEEHQQQQKKKPQRTTSSSTTPIADMFARKAATTTTTTATTIAPTAPAVVDQLPPSLDTSSPSLYSPSVRKPTKGPTEERRPGPAAPVSAAGAGAGAAHHHTAHTAHSSTSSPAVTVTIISSSSHVQTHNPRPWPPPATSRTVAPTRAQPVPAAEDSKPPARVQLREPRRAAFTPAAPAAAAAPVTATPGPLLARPRQHAGAAAVAEQQRLPPHHHHHDERQSAETKSHSTPTAMPSLSSTSTSPSTAMTLAPNPTLAEILRTDRRRSWQPAPTSAPSAAAAAAAAPTPRPSAPPSASAPWRGIPNRQTSVRLGADRLAWIRELEAGKRNRSSVNGDLPVLRTVQGSVADKLAKFESRQQEQQQQQQLQKTPLQGLPFTRSNSTRSRPSSIADTFSSYGGGGGGATTRSSLDSHRASSVFSHYDDSFREKLELITGKAGREADDEKKEEEKPPLTRVTSTFVSVERRRKQACVDKAQPV